MNIKRAKQEIKDTIEAYLQKDDCGDYVIPVIRQRPVLLLGAPGIGKTQIMEQIAKECKIALVAYSITHHTRQSAIGLPFVSKKKFGGKEYTVTEYTMSEIVASVYEKMEKTGLREGILFIDEINCASETLAPAMLQFLQCKTFGSHEIPKGWIIVAAGNPPEYNKSVREFDVVTMDRVKKIEVEPDFSVWKEYALRRQLHPAILSYLNTRPAYFYKMETTVDGRSFATPRGWEDLSQMLTVYEQLDKNMDREVVVQYIQHETIARDFANYLELYRKYQMDYQLDAVLNGTIDPILLKKASHASFDERLSVVSLLLARCRNRFFAFWQEEAVTELLYKELKPVQEQIQAQIQERHRESEQRMEQMSGKEQADSLRCDVRNRLIIFSPRELLQRQIKSFQKESERMKQAELLDRAGEQIRRRTEQQLTCAERLLQDQKRVQLTQRFCGAAQEQESSDPFEREASAALSCLKDWFAQRQDRQDAELEQAGQMLEHAFDFLEAAFGGGQEMVIFITELNSDFYSVQFLQEYSCERYYRYNRDLLFEEGSRSIEARLQALGK